MSIWQRIFRTVVTSTRKGFAAFSARRTPGSTVTRICWPSCMPLGCPMHAVSNYSIWYEIIEEKLKLSRFLQWTFVSTRTGLRKPDPRCYSFAMETLNVSPADCIFVDDRTVNVEAAARLGMDAIQARGVEALRADLLDRGVLSK